MDVTVIERGKRMGFGTAISDGLRAALRLAPDYIVTMDADLSHAPGDLPRLVETCTEGTLTIGSRYVDGESSPGLSTGRHLVSRLGNWAARETLALPIRDCTSGFRCYHHSVAETNPPQATQQGIRHTDRDLV